MKNTSKSVIIFAASAFLFLEAAPGVLAFQAVLLPNQSLKVTQGEVLGKEDEQSGSGQSGSPQKTLTPEEYKKFEADYIKANNITPEQIKARDERVAAERAKTTKSGVNPVLPTQSVANKKIRLSVEDNKGKLEVLDKNRAASGSAKRPEPTGTEPQKDGQQFEDRFVKIELVNGANRPQASSAAGLPRRIEDDSNRPERLEDQNVIIQTPPSQDIPTQLEIQSRETRSFVQSGSNVTVDPKTNGITVSDQEGQDRPLLRLPDQAFAELTTQGAVFPDHYDEAKANLVIQTKDDGTVVYHTEVTDQRKLFGFIPYNVKVAHEVNDQTGEVTTQDVQDTSFFGRFRQLFGN